MTHFLHTHPLPTPKEAFFTQLCTEALRAEGAFVLFKRPFSQEIEGFWGKKKDWVRLPLQDLHKISKGFLVYPFEASQQGAYMLKPSLYLSLNDKAYRYTCLSGEEKYWRNCMSQPASALHIPETLYGSLCTDPPMSQAVYMDMVKEALAAMTSKRLQKVVLSRYKKLTYQAPQQLMSTFFRLVDFYPSTFVYFLCAPEIGVWMGASPELLVSRTNNTLQSMALAATQAVPPSGDIHDVVWDEKECQEQCLVKQYITEQLQLVGMQGITTQATETIRVGDILHLRTCLSGTVSAVNNGLLGKILQHLHPTPALCGYPVQAAQDFIAAHEPRLRAFYGGVLGPIYHTSTYQLHVNIRCARFYQDHLQLHAGCGILPTSDPYKEWLETELKCMAMQRLFNT